MQWNGEQGEALKSIERWFKNDTKRKQVYRMFGYAGTGKTTIAEYMQQLAPSVGYAALSGKAASVLASKGCTGARTIHSLIYRPQKKKKTVVKKGKPVEVETDEIEWVLNPTSDLLAMNLLVVDEVSMVGEEIGNDLLSFGIPILVIGDPFQLPPVEGGGFFMQKPDVTLNEIHRQAKDNPIIRMASQVRLEKDMLEAGDYGEGNAVLRENADLYDTLYNAEQVLCGTNVKRQRFNQKIRTMLDKDVLDYPQVNDKIICLKNYQDRGLMNGTIWWVHDSRLNSDHTISMTVKNVFDDDEFIPIKVESTLQMFQFKDKDTLEGIKFGRIGRGFDQFDFGYAITVHKAQGSQWDDVVVYDDSWSDKKDPDFRYRWLYTAITRAAKTVKIIGKR